MPVKRVLSAIIGLLLLLVAAPGVRGATSEGQLVVGHAGLFASGEVVNRDSRAELNWSFAPDAVSGKGLKGVRLYRLREGDEIRYQVKPLELVQDLGMATNWTTGKLRNGHIVEYFARAYNAAGQEIGQAVFIVRPGRTDSSAATIRNLYAVGGDKAIAIFWDPSDRSDVLHYEVSRKAEGEAAFTQLSLVPLAMKVPLGSSSGGTALPILADRPTMYRDAKAEPGKTYVYQVTPVDAQGGRGTPAQTGSVSCVPPRAPAPDELLLLVARGSQESMAVAQHYATSRGVPAANILQVELPKVSHQFRDSMIVDAVRRYLLATRTAGKVRVIVPCYGIPLGDWQRSLDSMLADPFDRFTWGRVMGTPSPFFGQTKHFDGTYGIYLVARLDGPNARIAMSLVDKAREAEKSVSARSGASYFTDEPGQRGTAPAAKYGVRIAQNKYGYTKDHLIADDTMWLFASGHDYSPIRRGKWPVGSVAAFLKSNTLARINLPKATCWVQGLLEEGVTATFGAVTEPYVQGYTRGDMFFDRFWSGEYCFVEAFAMATPTVRWAMAAVGDPLYHLNKIGQPAGAQ